MRFAGRQTAAVAAVLWLGLAGAGAGTLRVATWNPELTRPGPGLLLAGLDKGDDAQIAAVVQVIATARPDVLLLTGLDWDYEGRALAALVAQLAAAGVDYPHSYAPRPNTGMPTGFDADGNGRLGEPRDAQGYGRFTGAGGMAILSRYPLGEPRDFSGLLWRDLPGSLSQDAPDLAAVQRLSTTAHWDVPVETPGGPLHLWAYAATPPVFDGDEDRNGRRNHDETAFWLRYLDGELPSRPAPEPFVILGTPNLDPVDGEGRRAALHALLSDPRVRDLHPTSPGAAAAPQTGANAAQQGNPAEDTARFAAEGSGNAPGNLRSDMILPDARLSVAASGVLWPAAPDPIAAVAETASRHALVWVDLTLP